MIDYDFRFWDAYYRWSLQLPSDRIMADFNRSLISVALVLSDSFSPAVRKAYWALRC